MAEFQFVTAIFKTDYLNSEEFCQGQKYVFLLHQERTCNLASVNAAL